MLEKLLFTCNAVFPIISLICVGYVLKRIRLLPQDFFKMLNKLSFGCLLPCLLFCNVYNVGDIGEIARCAPVVLFAILSILAFYAVGFVVAVASTKDDTQKGVLLQASYRSNYAIIGISLAMSLCGEDKTPVKIASILSSITIPLFNVLATIALSVFVGDKKGGSKLRTALSIALKVCKNPLIQGVAAGIVVLAVREAIPESDGRKLFLISRDIPFIYSTVKSLGSAASTVALIALGGNFEFSAVSKLKKLIATGTLMRVVVCPAVCLCAAYAAGFRSLEFPALIALYGTPIAVSSVPMAAEMGNDAELAGQLVVWTTLASALTLFATIFICAQIGIFAV